MKALVYTDTEELTYRDEKDPIKTEGESILKVHASGICGEALVGNSPVNDSPSAWKRPWRSLLLAGPNVSMIFGITSPRRTIRTLSPIDTPKRSTSPTLCKVVFSTVTPLTTTGATRATGVTAPVRPVCQSISSRTVIASSGGNFQARAHRG